MQKARRRILGLELVEPIQCLDGMTPVDHPA